MACSSRARAVSASSVADILQGREDSDIMGASKSSLQETGVPMTPNPSQPPVTAASNERCFIQGRDQGAAPAPANANPVGMITGAMSAELQQVVVEL